MDLELLKEIKLLNPWLDHPGIPVISDTSIIPRVQTQQLLHPEWDRLWTILIGPRRAGKTTLGKYLSQQLLSQHRYEQLFYLNCDYQSIRNWLSAPAFLSEAMKEFSLVHPILFIDEVQRLKNPGLLLKAIIDLGLPFKHIATGSSQLEIRSRVQEFLTGRQLTSLILPLSHEEWEHNHKLDEVLIYGCYPQVLLSEKKDIQLTEIYHRYIQKDIIEILKIGQPDIFHDLVTLMAHTAGQLINYGQLAIDCKVSVTTVRNYLDILEQTFVLAKIKPFVGNKRVEVTSNPVYYFIDNGLRNTALRNFASLSTRTDIGFLVENFIFQEIFKFRAQHYLDFDIHYWRTKSGAEVDFILYKNKTQFIPIEVKYRRMRQPSVTRSLRSFIQAYNPNRALVITLDLIATKTVNGTEVVFMPLRQIKKLFQVIRAEIS